MAAPKYTVHAPRRFYARNFRNKKYTTKKTDPNLKVMEHPFSVATTTPKIPDGKAYDSAGLRLQSTKEITTKTSGDVWVLLYPGLNCGAWIFFNEPTPEEMTLGYYQHGMFKKDGDKFVQEENSAISRWRIVSQGLRMSLLNNDDENDGWWEAIRTQMGAHQTNEFNILGDTAIVGPSTDYASGNYLTVNVDSLNMVEHPTYCSGKLKDLDKTNFYLRPTGGDHDFINLDQSFKIASDQPAKAFLDVTWDCILIKIHGRKEKLTDPKNVGSRLLLNLCCNQELVYDEAAILARHHTKAEEVPTVPMANTRRRMKRNSRAASKVVYSSRLGKY
jgi:hypothetical protein